MKTILFIVFSAFCATASAAQAGEEFAGKWTGDGSVLSPFAQEASQFEVEIEVKPTRVVITECWTKQEGGKAFRPCIISQYTVQNGSQLYKGGKRVGELYPEKIQVLVANSQVFEQLVFLLRKPGSIYYSYSYGNFDGISQQRRVALSSVK